MKIGPLNKNLKSRIDKLQDYIVPQPAADASPEAQIENLEDLLSDLEADLSRIASWTEELGIMDAHWQTLILADETGSEEAVFEDFVKKNEYSKVLIDGQEAETKLRSQKSKLVRAINKLKKQVGQPLLPETPVYSSSGTPIRGTVPYMTTANRSPAPAAPTVQLPKMGMKSFSGDFKAWIPWSNWFKVTIKNNMALSQLQKFMYLVSCMEPGSKAERCIAPIEITEANFEVAWTKLEDACGGDKNIIRNHWRNLQQLPQLKSNGTNATELRKQLDSIELAVNQLEQMGEDVQSKSMAIIIQQKWPPRVVERLLEREAQEVNGSWNTNSMLKALDHIIRLQEEVSDVCFTEAKRS